MPMPMRRYRLIANRQMQIFNRFQCLNPMRPEKRIDIYTYIINNIVPIASR